MILKLKLSCPGTHIRVEALMGEDEASLLRVGELLLNVGEWQLLGAALGLGAKQTMGQFTVKVEGQDEAIAAAGRA